MPPDRTEDISLVADALKKTVERLIRGELDPSHADVAVRVCETLLAAYEAEAAAYRKLQANTKGGR
jgi:hypothetical protein